MSPQDRKQFGIWMDNHQAIVVGKVGDGAEFGVIAHVTNAGASANSSERNANNEEQTLERKFFKEILSHMQNAEDVHLTGTGTAQEQLINFMKETPQYKNTVTTESTANPMSDEKVVEYIASKF